MPSAVASGHPPSRHDGLDNYDVDDLSDDPFASPSPSSSAKKRKQPDSGLGIDEEVSVQRRARVPGVKLDEVRLLGPAGIPRLRARAAHDLRLKGKGHEFSDASRLLSFYQLWLDDLFPKANFHDALAMVEKAGHKKLVVAARTEWINEAKPRPREGEEEELLLLRKAEEPRGNTAQASQQPARPQTPVRTGDIPDDDDDLYDDLYDATPTAAVPTRTRTAIPDDEDDLNALIAEAEGNDGSSRPHRQPQASNAELDGDDLEALIAEAEGQDQGKRKQPSNAAGGQGNTDFDDEAAMQEMEGLW
ncbi:Chromosome segregation in meiosis protein 3 [Tolypocladium capitatum]|uniref:Chromosome segregation in meiosis protein n=1 Tax=Tolypocladium capitatum TaxID=45235 RepID=A0A2K3QGA6_9HYPO|nr:Chromosome segregation in meiosis protein 3 [Tolypocladium capitatum]